MNGWSALDRFLRTDPRDVGCAEAMDLLHVYTDLAGADATAAAQRYPGIAVHRRACCGEDFDGLPAAASGSADWHVPAARQPIRDAPRPGDRRRPWTTTRR